MLKRSSLLISTFTFAAGCWLLVMEFLLDHEGYLGRSGVAMYIAGQSLVTLFWLVREDSALLRRLAVLGAFLFLVIGLRATLNLTSARHFEGFTALIGAALLTHSLLTCAIVVNRRRMVVT